MPPGLATTCAGNATWMCLSGGFRKNPRPCVLGWHLNVSAWRISKGPATMRAGVGGDVTPERTSDSALDHAHWGEHLEVPDWRISGDSRPRALGWIQGSAPERRISKGPATIRAGAGGGVPPERTCDSAFDHARWGGHLEVLDRRISGDSRPCALGWKRLWRRLGCLHRDGVQPCTPWLRVPLRVRSVYIPCCRTKAAKRLPFYISHREPALLPECRGSERERTPEASSSTAQGR